MRTFEEGEGDVRLRPSATLGLRVPGRTTAGPWLEGVGCVNGCGTHPVPMPLTRSEPVRPLKPRLAGTPFRGYWASFQGDGARRDTYLLTTSLSLRRVSRELQGRGRPIRP